MRAQIVCVCALCVLVCVRRVRRDRELARVLGFSFLWVGLASSRVYLSLRESVSGVFVCVYISVCELARVLGFSLCALEKRARESKESRSLLT